MSQVKKTVSRFFAVFLAVAMLLSVMAIIPVNAATTAEGASYFYWDFEDGDKSDFYNWGAHGSSIKIANDGAGGSSKSMEWTETGIRSDNGNPIESSDIHFTSSGAAQKYTISAGGSLEISFKIKLAQKLTSGYISVRGKGSDGAGNYANMLVEIDENNTTDWQDVKFTYSNLTKGDITFDLLAIIFAKLNLSNGSAISGQCNYNADTYPESFGTRKYYIDNFLICTHDNGSGSSDDVLTLPNYHVGYEHTDTYYSTVAGDGSNFRYFLEPKKGSATREVVSGGANSSGGAVKISFTEGGECVRYQLRSTASVLGKNYVLKNGCTIEFSMDLKLSQTLSDGEFRLVIYKAGYGANYGNTVAINKNTTDWQNITYSYTNDTGADTTLECIWLSFCDSTGSKCWSDNTEATNLSFLLDNIDVNINGVVVVNTYPVVKDFVVNGKINDKIYEEHEISFSYGQLEAGGEEATTGDSIVNLYRETAVGSGKYILVKSYLKSKDSQMTYSVPKDTEGMKLKLEILPLSATTSAGKWEVFEIGAPVKELSATSEITYEEGVFTAKATVNNQKLDGSNVDAVLAVIFYGADKRVVGTIMEKELNAPNMGSDSDEIVLTTLPQGAVSARSFLLECDEESINNSVNTTMNMLSEKCIWQAQ